MTILAGKSQYLVSTKVEIVNLRGEDRYLNGLTGSLTHPFGFLGAYDHGAIVGIWLDEESCQKLGVQPHSNFSSINLKAGEFTVCEGEN